MPNDDEHGIGWYTVGHGPLSNKDEWYGALPASLIAFWLGFQKYGLKRGLALAGAGWAVGKLLVDFRGGESFLPLPPGPLSDPDETGDKRVRGLWQLIYPEAEYGDHVVDPESVSVFTKLLRLIGVNP